MYELTWDEATMPNDGQQTGIIAAIAGAVVGLIGLAGTRIGALINRQTTLDVKVIDSKDGYTDDLREDLRTLRVEFKELSVLVRTLEKENVAKEKEIGLLTIELESLKKELARMQDEKRQSRQEYEEAINRLQNELVEKDNEIARLRHQIEEYHTRIGIAETKPPKRTG